MTHNTSNVSNNAIEPWQLTAYALNELEPDDAARVEQALEVDSALRAEFEQIQQTLSAVRSALVGLPTSVTLSEKQTAKVAYRIEQVVASAPLASALLASVPLASVPLASRVTVKLAERPFYRRKRFAALLVTAAAIPLAATYLPSFFDKGGPLAVDIPSQTKPSASYLNDDIQYFPAPNGEAPQIHTMNDGERAAIVPPPDAIRAEDGLIGDADTSFVPEMGLVIIKGSKQDVRQLQEVIKGIKDGESTQSLSTLAISSEAKQENGFASGPIASGEVASNADRRIKLNLDAIADSKGESKAELSQDGYGSVGLGFGGYPGGGGVGGPNGLGGKSASGYGSSMGVNEKPGPGMSVSGMAGQAANGPQPTAGASSSLASEASPEAEEFDRLDSSKTESLATYDKRLRDETLPEELRQNAPHLFNRAKIAESSTDRFEKIVETPFLETQKAPLSTFSIDVDTASYSKIRQTLMEGNRLPSPSMVRIEEMVNYFEYEYAGPQEERPFAAHMKIDRCPWNTEHQLVRIGLQAKKLDAQKRVKANIVFLLDVSGSMNEPNKLPLVKKALSMLVNQLTENDRVAIVVYAGAAGCVLPSICGAEKQTILSSLDHLNAGGSTNGGQGIQLAYSIAKEHFIPGGANRVVLCTDGDFNVGVTGDDALVAMMQENAKSNIFLTCLGFGAGNYNDTMMEKISNKGNGVYGMIDNELEARRMMVEQLGGTLVTVAKDVKIQVDFNPAKVAGYRLIGYEDRRLANKDFDDDKKDAGEIGAGHRVTALYEVIPAGKWVGGNPPSQGESSKYLQKPNAESKFETPAVAEEYSSELLTLKVRYKEPEGNESTMQEFVLKETDRNDQPLMDRDMQWATAVAEFGLLLRRSEMAPHADWSDMLERATSSAGGDAYRLECLAMMRKARSMFP